MANPESRIVRRIMQALGEKFPRAYFRKIHGNAFQHVGIPDIIGCVEGVFIGLEVKTDTGRVSRVQELEGEAIVRASGRFGVVRTPEEAVSVVIHELRQVENLPSGRRIKMARKSI